MLEEKDRGNAAGRIVLDLASLSMKNSVTRSFGFD